MDLIAILSGVLVGFTLGLVGGGGSVLATPLLLYAIVGLPPHVAIGTGAFAVAVNAFSNLLAQVRSGRILWKYAILFAIFGSFGAFIGSSIGKAMNGDKLIFLFGLAMLGVGAAMLRPVEPKLDASGKVVASTWKTVLVALGVGCLAGFFGIGGGVLIVPGLVLATRMPMLNAISTSLLAVTSFGATTAINYAVSGLVAWLIALQFIGGGMLGGYVGIRSGVYLSRYKGALNKAFALLVFGVASYVLYRSGSTFLGPTFAPQQVARVAVEQKAFPQPAEPAPTELKTEPSGAPTAQPVAASPKPALPAVPHSTTAAKLRAILVPEPRSEAGIDWFDLESVRFAAGKTRLNPAAHAQLRVVAEILAADSNAKVIIGGHTDTSGDARANRRVSEQRARSVLRELVRLGVDPSRLEARGFGADRPLAPSTGPAEDRRASLGLVRE